MDFESVINFLKDTGVFSVLFPVILVFAIVFSILDNVDLFKNKAKDTKNLNIIISLVFALIFTISAKFIFVIENLFPKIALLIIVFLCLKIIFAYINLDYEKLFSNKYFLWFYVIIILSIGFFSFKLYNYIYTDLEFKIPVEILVFVIFIGTIYYITKSPSSKKVKSNSKTNKNENNKKNENNENNIGSKNDNQNSNSKNKENQEKDRKLSDEEMLESMSPDEFAQKKLNLKKEDLEREAKNLKPGEQKEFKL